MRVFLEVLGLEFLQNIPLFVGFVVAVRLWKRDWRWSIGILLLSAIGTTAVIHLTEGMIARLAGTHYTTSTGDFFVSLAIFLVGGLVSLLYFAVLSPKIDWALDLLFAIILGSLMTLSQSTLLPRWSTVIGHFVAITLAILLALLTFKYVIRLPRWSLVIVLSTAITLLVSVLITVVDYGPFITG